MLFPCPWPPKRGRGRIFLLITQKEAFGLNVYTVKVSTGNRNSQYLKKEILLSHIGYADKRINDFAAGGSSFFAI